MHSDVSVDTTPDGRRLVVARDIAADRERAWELLTDTERWPDWGPSVRAVESDSRSVRPGTTGRVRLPGGVWLPFEITTCADYRWTWEVARIPATGHRIEQSDSAGTCRVGFEVPLLAAGYLPVCSRALGRIAALLEDQTQSSSTVIPVE